MQQFDPNLFLAQTIDAPLSEKRLLVPEGEYKGIILADKISANKFDSDNGTFYKLQLQLEILDENGEVQKATHRDKNIVRHDVFLDLTEFGGLDMREGMNVQLGQLRAACRQNNPGQAWTFSMLGGQIIGFTVRHKADKNGDLRENVVSVKQV